MHRLIVIALVGLLVSACAPVVYTKADLDGKIVCNVDYMDQVERAARRNFATVVWVNCPRATLRVVT
ncbi:MAG TPA: hypothetical protein VNG69_00280 [Casimicrobiaceae bacterium]|nr:hypothetical protein [Casimicrobiaceae bacterium]